MKKGIKMGVTILGVVSLLMVDGCLKTPDIEYVTNKENQGNYTYVENNSSSGSIAEQVGALAHVEQEGKTLNDNTYITVDADVRIPEGQAVPVYSVAPLSITEDMLEFYVGRIYDGEIYRFPYYSSMYEMPPQSKESIYRWIEEYQCFLDQYPVMENQILDDHGFVVDESGDFIEGVISQEEYNFIQGQITALQQELITAPEEQELLREVSYEWEPHTIQKKDFSEDGMEMVYQDYNYDVASFVGQRNGQQFYLNMEKDNRYSIISLDLDGKEKLENGYCYGDLRINPTELFWAEGSRIENQCQYTVEEAKELCRGFLTDLELRDMDVQAVRYIQVEVENHNLGLCGYQIYCYRTYNGIGDTLYNGFNKVEEQGDSTLIFTLPSMYRYYQATNSFEEREGIGREIAVFTILDDGIVKAEILNPMVNQELLAENTKMINFDTILNQAVTQMSIQYGDMGTPGNVCRINVTDIELNYACMESPNKNQEYTMIPVWDFKSGLGGVTYVTINAVDGTVFDRGIGH